MVFAFAEFGWDKSAFWNLVILGISLARMGFLGWLFDILILFLGCSSWVVGFGISRFGVYSDYVNL